MGFTLAELNEQIQGYRNQLSQSQIIQQQIAGAIHAIEHQIKLLLEKEIAAQAQQEPALEPVPVPEVLENAIEEGIEQENNPE